MVLLFITAVPNTKLCAWGEDGTRQEPSTLIDVARKPSLSKFQKWWYRGAKAVPWYLVSPFQKLVIPWKFCLLPLWLLTSSGQPGCGRVGSTSEVVGSLGSSHLERRPSTLRLDNTCVCIAKPATPRAVPGRISGLLDRTQRHFFVRLVKLCQIASEGWHRSLQDSSRYYDGCLYSVFPLECVGGNQITHESKSSIQDYVSNIIEHSEEQFSTIPLPPSEQVNNRYCSNKHTHSFPRRTARDNNHDSRGRRVAEAGSGIRGNISFLWRHYSVRQRWECCLLFLCFCALLISW